jgi:hypothetical protein
MLIEEHGWHLVNVLDTPTHSFRKGIGSSVLDLMIAAPSVAREVSNWAIDEENPTGSNYEVVTFQITSLYPVSYPTLKTHFKNGDSHQVITQARRQEPLLTTLHPLPAGSRIMGGQEKSQRHIGRGNPGQPLRGTVSDQ